MAQDKQPIEKLDESEETEEGVSSTSQRRKRGIIDANKVRMAAFFIITICLIFIVGGAILVIWDYARPDVAVRTVATCSVIAVGTALFAAVNGAFGSYADEEDEE